MDYCYLWGHQSSKTDKPARKYQKFDNHKCKPQEPKSQSHRYFDNTKISEKARKKKKKNKCQNKQERWVQE